MCDLTKPAGTGPVAGYKVVAEDDLGGRWSAAMGFRYRDGRRVPIVRAQRQLVAGFFSDRMLEPTFLCGFSDKMVGRTALFLSRDDARLGSRLEEVHFARRAVADQGRPGERRRRCVARHVRRRAGGGGPPDPLREAEGMTVEDVVEISREEYGRLARDGELLEALRRGGVCGWEGYGGAVDEVLRAEAERSRFNEGLLVGVPDEKVPSAPSGRRHHG